MQNTDSVLITKLSLNNVLMMLAASMTISVVLPQLGHAAASFHCGNVTEEVTFP